MEAHTRTLDFLDPKKPSLLLGEVSSPVSTATSSMRQKYNKGKADRKLKMFRLLPKCILSESVGQRLIFLLVSLAGILILQQILEVVSHMRSTDTDDEYFLPPGGIRASAVATDYARQAPLFCEEDVLQSYAVCNGFSNQFLGHAAFISDSIAKGNPIHIPDAFISNGVQIDPDGRGSLKNVFANKKNSLPLTSVIDCDALLSVISNTISVLQDMDVLCGRRSSQRLHDRKNERF